MSSFVSRIFGTTSTAGNAPVVTQQQTGNLTAPNATATVPAVPAAPAAPAAPVSPLDQFSKLWEPATTAGVDPTLPANMFAGTDPAKMLEAARKVDFAKNVDPAVLAKITAGGPDAAAAFAQAMNDIGQRAYAQSSFAATKIVETALEKFQQGLDARLPNQVKSFQVSEALKQSNPALTHPAAAPIMEALQAQMTVKYPNATVSEINDLASQYLTQFGAAFAPPKAAPATPASEDWDKFFA